MLNEDSNVSRKFPKPSMGSEGVGERASRIKNESIPIILAKISFPIPEKRNFIDYSDWKIASKIPSTNSYLSNGIR